MKKLRYHGLGCELHSCKFFFFYHINNFITTDVQKNMQIKLYVHFCILHSATNLTHFYFLHHIPHMNWPRAKPCLRGEQL